MGFGQVFVLCTGMLGFLAAAVQVKGVNDGVPQIGISPGPHPTFTAARGLNPTQFLIISSPKQKKVVYTPLQNFESMSGTPFVLVDTGLVEPRGVALDRNKGTLYVADSGAQAIFRYTLVPVMRGSMPSLQTTGLRLTVMQGHPVVSVTLDDEGNLFYSAPDTNNINKIPAQVLNKLGQGQYLPSSLVIISQKTLTYQETESANYVSAEQAGGLIQHTPGKTDPATTPPIILSIYEAYLNQNVSSPAGLFADGPDLYWVNNKNGLLAGTVVKGQTHPKSVASAAGPMPFPADALTHNSQQGWGIAKANDMIVFTRTGPTPKVGFVSALMAGTDITVDLSDQLQAPRGVVYDRDGTMYVADEVLGNVWSFPCGRMMSNVPLTKTVQMPGAYALALLSSNDPAFKLTDVSTSGLGLSTQGVAPGMVLPEEDQQSLMQNAKNFLKYSSSRRRSVLDALAGFFGS